MLRRGVAGSRKNCVEPRILPNDILRCARRNTNSRTTSIKDAVSVRGCCGGGGAVAVHRARVWHPRNRFSRFCQGAEVEVRPQNHSQRSSSSGRSLIDPDRRFQTGGSSSIRKFLPRPSGSGFLFLRSGFLFHDAMWECVFVIFVYREESKLHICRWTRKGLWLDEDCGHVRDSRLQMVERECGRAHFSSCFFRATTKFSPKTILPVDDFLQTTQSGKLNRCPEVKPLSLSDEIIWQT